MPENGKTPEMNFNITKPCSLCPFRKDVPVGWLGRARVEEIYNELAHGDKTFACHETTGAKGKKSAEESHCAGALILLEKEKDTMNNLPLRFAAITKLVNLNSLKGGELVFDTKEEFFQHHAR